MANYTTTTDAFLGYKNSITQGGITNPLAQAEVAGNILKIMYPNTDQYADDLVGKGSSIMRNLLDIGNYKTNRETIVREYPMARIVNTYIDPAKENNSTAQTTRRNALASTTTGNNVIYRTEYDLAANRPTYEQSFFRTLALAIDTTAKAPAIPEAQLLTMDFQSVFNTMEHYMRDVNVDYARKADRGILQAIFSTYTGVNESGVGTGTSYSIDYLSASKRIANSKQKSSMWSSEYEASLITNHKGLDTEGLSRLSNSKSVFEYNQKVRHILLLPNSYISQLLNDDRIITKFGLQEISNNLLDGKVFIPHSDGHMDYRRTSLPFDLLGFNTEYEDLFYANDGTNDYCNAIMLSPRTFCVESFADPIYKKFGQWIIERRYSTSTQAMDTIYIDKMMKIDIGLENPFLSKKIRLGVPA